MKTLVRVAAHALLLSACAASPAGSDAGSGDDAASSDASATDAATIDAVAPDADNGTGTITIGPAARPARLVAPTTVTGMAPLVVLLHGYSASAAIEDAYLGVARSAASRGIYVALPDGMLNPMGNRYWQGTPGCCDFYSSGVDDVAYLRALVHEAIARRPIDPSRVYFFGHSNGGFMSYRLACALASETAAIAVLAGSDFQGDMDCVPSRAVSVLHLHGTADTTIPYRGGAVGLAPFPGAETVVARWAARAGCGASPTMRPAIDLESTLAGAETIPTDYTGCRTGLDVRLLTIQGAAHIPTFQSGVIGTQVLDWLVAHHL